MTFEDDAPEWHDPNPVARQRSNTRTVLGATAAALVLLVGGTLAGTIALAGNAVPEPDGIVLQSLDSIGPGPFTPSVALNGVTVSDRAPGRIESAVLDSERGVQTVNGSTPGLYGGTNDNASCDTAALANFLGGDQSKSAAWASVFGIATDAVPYYLNTLTPVVLTQDTWVTNHSYNDGAATAYQSILESGTAVLVDSAGVPRVRCSCGNPLGPPATEPLSSFTPSGDQWESFEPGSVTAVNYATEAEAGQPVSTDANNATVNEFTLLDLTTLGSLVRPAGGTVDTSPLPALRTPLPDPVAMNVPRQNVSAVASGRTLQVNPLEMNVEDSPPTRPAITTDVSASTTSALPAPATPAPVVAISTPLAVTLPQAVPITEIVATSTASVVPSSTEGVVVSSITPTTSPSSVISSSVAPQPVPTVFTGDAAGAIQSFVLSTDVTCSEAPASQPADPLEVEFTCVDSANASVTTRAVLATDLTANAVTKATTDGLWKLRLDDAVDPTPILSAIRSVD